MPLIPKSCDRQSRQCAKNAPSNPVYRSFAAHEIGCELKAMSRWLDEHCDLLGLVARDLCRGGIKAAGRHGLPAEAVLGCALLK